MDESRVVYEKLVDGTVYVEGTYRSDVLHLIKDRLHKHAESAKTFFRTASLWVQYMGMLYILRRSNRAERTGNYTYNPSRTCLTTWQPQVTTCTQNLPGCNIQQVATLKEEHPDVHPSVDDGLHVYRRSDRLWAGLSWHRTIE